MGAEVPTVGQLLLSVNDVTKAFGGVLAIDKVSLRVASESIVGLVGPNGAGKSTLISLMSGFMRADSGSITFDGYDVARLGPARLARMGLTRTFQAASPLARMTVLENVLVGLSSRYKAGFGSVLFRSPSMRREEKAMKAEAGSLLERFHLSDVAQSPARDLPFGRLRFLEIARAAAVQPRLLLLDEPAAGLNQREVEELASLIRALRTDGTSVLLVDHDVSFLFGLCEDVTVLNFGTVVASGPSVDVRTSPELRAAYLGDAYEATEDSL
jgi:ABC-type branched-subunit amino acid transport system ATPase component